MSLPKVFESDRLNGCPALSLAVSGWSELFTNGYSSDCVSLQWDQSAVWIEEAGSPVAVIVWQFQDYRREVWISLSYVRPECRRKGYFRALYSRVIELGGAKGATRIAGGVRPNNDAMRTAAYQTGRRIDYVVYAADISERSLI